MSALPDTVTVLAVAAGRARPRARAQALKAIERPRYEIHWVTSAEAALAALDEHPHDAFLVDCELGRPRRSPQQILAHTPHAPVLLLDDAPTATSTWPPPRPASPST